MVLLSYNYHHFFNFKPNVSVNNSNALQTVYNCGSRGGGGEWGGGGGGGGGVTGGPEPPPPWKITSYMGFYRE